MDDLYNTFINLSLQQCSLEDYSNKQKVRIHNVATKKLMVSKAAYLYIGGSIYLGFDMISFCEEIDEIFFSNGKE